LNGLTRRNGKIMIAPDVPFKNSCQPLAFDNGMVVAIVLSLEPCRNAMRVSERIDIRLIGRLPITARDPERVAIPNGDLDVIGGSPIGRLDVDLSSTSPTKTESDFAVPHLVE
jgi:hypothetical protein